MKVYLIAFYNQIYLNLFTAVRRMDKEHQKMFGTDPPSQLVEETNYELDQDNDYMNGTFKL